MSSRPDADTVIDMARLVRSHDRFVTWLTAWRDAELAKLPYVKAHTDVAQGRCQALNELLQRLDEARNIRSLS